jgi:hypothetical protein
VRDIAICKYDLIDFHIFDQFDKVALRVNIDPVGIQFTGQLCGITAAFDVGDLRGGESYNFIVFIVAKEDIEIVEIAPGGSHDKCTDWCHVFLLGYGLTVPVENIQPGSAALRFTSLLGL